MSNFYVGQKVLVNSAHATILAKVENSFIVQVKEDNSSRLYIFDNEGAYTSNNTIRMVPANSEYENNIGKMVISNAYGIGTITEYDHTFNGYFIEFKDDASWFKTDFKSHNDEIDDNLQIIPDNLQFIAEDIVEVSDNAAFNNSYIARFYKYTEDETYPYIVLLYTSDDNYSEMPFRYCRHFDRTKYIAKQMSK